MCVCFPRSLFSPKFDEPEQCSKYPVLHRFPRSSWSCGECNRGHPRTMSPMFEGYNLYDPPTVNLSKFTTAPGSIKQTWWFWCDLMWFVSLLLKVSLPKWWGWPITEQSLTKVSKWSSICRLVVFFFNPSSNIWMFDVNSSAPSGLFWTHYLEICMKTITSQ